MVDLTKSRTERYNKRSDLTKAEVRLRFYIKKKSTEKN